MLSPVLMSATTEAASVAAFISLPIAKHNIKAPVKKPNEKRKIDTANTGSVFQYTTHARLINAQKALKSITGRRFANRSEIKPKIGAPTANPMKIQEISEAAFVLEV